MISKEVFMEILAMHRSGKSIRAIAKVMGQHRNTIKKHLAGDDFSYYRKTAARESILAPHVQTIQDYLDEDNYKATWILDRLKNWGYVRGYDMLILSGTINAIFGMLLTAAYRGKELLTILGPVAHRRSMFRCPACRATRYPGDEALDVAGTTRSPGLRRMMARAGSQSTFKDGRDDLRIYAGLEVSAKDVERVAEGIGQQMESWSSRERQEILSREDPPEPEKNIPVMYVSYDGTGVPMTREELKGVRGKQPDGTARTREAKLGCVFTQTRVDEEGYPIRDPDTTTFVGAIETAETFGWRIYGEARRRGLAQARKVVVLGDGAEWVKNLAEWHFPGAILIVDLYHARQHVSGLCRSLFGLTEKKMERQRRRWWASLDAGRVEQIVRQARQQLPVDPDLKKAAEAEIRFLDKNKERMRYNTFRAQGLFVGSGVVEAGCKTVIGQRLKQSGMEWTVRGANAIIALRCMMKSNRLEDYWESRVA